MVVNGAVERGRHVLADRTVDVLHTTGMLKVLDVVKNTFEEDPLLVVVQRQVLEFLPSEDRQIGDGCTVSELTSDSSELLLLHLDLALGDFVAGELLQVIGETELGKCPDEPLGGIVLVVDNSVAVVLRELMVEVVITFTQSSKGSNPVVARGMMIIEGIFTKPVRKAVDAESRMMNKTQSEDSSIKVTTL